MKASLTLLTIVMSFVLLSCIHKEKRTYNHTDKEIVEVWENFLKTVKQKDNSEYRKLSSDKIDCCKAFKFCEIGTMP